MTISKQTTFSFRPAADTDFDFLYGLHEAALRTYIEEHWGWNEIWQKEYFESRFDPLSRQIIRIDGADAGVLEVVNKEEEHYIAVIAVLPEFQGRGVGTEILGSLLEEAEAQDKTLTLHVLKSNKPAQRLYLRLGFFIVDEGAYHYKMASREPEKMRSD